MPDMELALFYIVEPFKFLLTGKLFGHICGLERKLEVTLGMGKSYRRELQIREPSRDHCCSPDASTLVAYPQAFLPHDR